MNRDKMVELLSVRYGDVLGLAKTTIETEGLDQDRSKLISDAIVVMDCYKRGKKISWQSTLAVFMVAAAYEIHEMTEVESTTIMRWQDDKAKQDQSKAAV